MFLAVHRLLPRTPKDSNKFYDYLCNDDYISGIHEQTNQKKKGFPKR